MFAVKYAEAVVIDNVQKSIHALDEFELEAVIFHFAVVQENTAGERLFLDDGSQFLVRVLVDSLVTVVQHHFFNDCMSYVTLYCAHIRHLQEILLTQLENIVQYVVYRPLNQSFNAGVTFPVLPFRNLYTVFQFELKRRRLQRSDHLHLAFRHGRVFIHRVRDALCLDFSKDGVLFHPDAQCLFADGQDYLFLHGFQCFLLCQAGNAHEGFVIHNCEAGILEELQLSIA